MGLISTLTEIADSIRDITGLTVKIQLAEMAGLIDVGGQMQYEDGYNAGLTDGYASGNTAGYNSGYSAGKTDGAAAVTLSSSVSGRTVTTKASNGKTSSGSVALGTNSGSLTFTLNTSGNGSATKSLSAGYYNAGTVTAKGTQLDLSNGEEVFASYNATYTASSWGLYIGYGYYKTSTGTTATKFTSNGTVIVNTSNIQGGERVAHLIVAYLSSGQYITNNSGGHYWACIKVS